MDNRQDEEKIGKPVHIKTIIKQIMMQLYCRGLLPKETTQRLFEFLDLKED
jgi:hypothetical protein